MTTHVRVRWHHDAPDQPVLSYRELDAAHHEVRTVEVYRDGRSRRAASARPGSEPAPEPIPAAVFETAWLAAEIDALATRFTSGFQERFGYPPDVHRVALATTPASGFSGELAVLYDVVHEVSLPDVWNGYSIHAPPMVLGGGTPTRLTGTVEDGIVVFGSDGGGAWFALSTSGRGVYRLAGGSFDSRAAPYRGGDVTVVAPDIARFLDFLRAEVRTR